MAIPEQDDETFPTPAEDFRDSLDWESHEKAAPSALWGVLSVIFQIVLIAVLIVLAGYALIVIAGAAMLCAPLGDIFKRD